MTPKKTSAWIVFIGTLLMLLGLLLIGAGFAHGATTSHKDVPNSLGAVLDGGNRNTNVMGLITGGTLIQAEDGRVHLNVAVLPKYAPMFAEQSILFCGDVTALLTEGPKHKIKQGTVVLTYRTAASRLVQGIGCHQLVGVDKVNDGLQ